MKKIPFLIAAGILVLGCKLLSPALTQPGPPEDPQFTAPQPEPTPVDCSSLTITDADVRATQQYGKDILSNGDWTSSYNVTATDVIVSYVSTGLQARIEFNTTVLCGAKTVLKNYLNDAYFNAFFSAYDSYAITDSCEKDGTLLYEVSAVYQNSNYSIRSWFEPLDDDNHFMITTAYFPQADTGNLDFYSAAFHPDYASCR